MKRTTAVVFVALGLAAVSVAASASPVSAQEGDSLSVSVSFESEDVSDGEKVEILPTQEIKVVATARSGNELNTLEGRLHNTTVTQGINGTSHNVSHALSTRPGPNFYTVKVTDMKGNVATSTVNFYRIPSNTVQVKRVVERLEQRKTSLEEDIGSLEERKESLQEENEDLRQRRQEVEEERLSLDSQSGAGGDSDGEGEEPETDEVGEQSLPGFTAIAALVAAVLAAVGVHRRR